MVLVTIGVGCDRGRAVQEVGAQGTRATHARDRAADRVEAERWQAEPDAGKPLPELAPVAETGLALGELEVVAERDGARLERQAWSFQEIRGTSWRVRVSKEALKLRVMGSEEVAPLRDFATPDEPFVAINGGFYDVDNQAMGLVISDGQEHATLRKNGGSGVLESREGNVAIVHRNDYVLGADEALQSIDRIIADGKSLMTEGRRERHTARSAIAIGESHVWFVVAFEDESVVPSESDDVIQLRSTSFRGLPLWAFARYLLETTEVQDALNLDGAVSTQMAASVGDTSLDVRGEMGTINAVFGYFAD